MHRNTRMSRKKLTIVSLAVVPLVAGLGFAVTQSAFAGTNGQQVELCQPHSHYNVVLISGRNQNDEGEIYSHKVTPKECTPIQGFFWKGVITIDWTITNLGTVSEVVQQGCKVPETSPVDTVKCFAPPHPQ